MSVAIPSAPVHSALAHMEAKNNISVSSLAMAHYEHSGDPAKRIQRCETGEEEEVQRLARSLKRGNGSQLYKRQLSSH